MTLNDAIVSLAGLLGTILAGCALTLVKALLDWVALRAQVHGLAITQEQKATIEAATETASGLLKAELLKGAMSIPDIHLSDPRVQAGANYILQSAPAAIAALGLNQTTLTQMIVGKLSNELQKDPSVPSVALRATSALPSAPSPPPLTATVA